MQVLRFFTSLAVAWTALSRMAGAAGPPEGPGVRVDLVLDAPSPMATRHVPGMIAEAAAVWRPNGVAVVLWTSSETAPGDVRLTLRFESIGERRTPARQPPRSASEGGEGLGAIWFDENGLPGQAIAVDLDAVAARSDAPRSTAAASMPGRGHSPT